MGSKKLRRIGIRVLVGDLGFALMMNQREKKRAAVRDKKKNQYLVQQQNRQAEAEAAATRERRRLAIEEGGRPSTIRTGMLGLTAAAPRKKKKLGGAI